MAPLVKLVSHQQDPAQLDLALMRSIASGDQKAFRQLHDRYHSSGIQICFAHSFKSRIWPKTSPTTRCSPFGKGLKNTKSVPKFQLGFLASYIARRRKTRWTFRFERFQEDISERHDLEDQGAETVEAFFERRRVRMALTKLPIQLRAVVELTYYRRPVLFGNLGDHGLC